MGVRGRHLLSGLPTEIQLHSAEVREAIRLPMEEILRAITATLEDTPPELAGDIARQGILLAGGGTLLRGLPKLVTDRTGMAVSLAESPLTCVAIGAGLAPELRLAQHERHRPPRQERVQLADRLRRLSKRHAQTIRTRRGQPP